MLTSQKMNFAQLDLAKYTRNSSWNFIILTLPLFQSPKMTNSLHRSSAGFLQQFQQSIFYIFFMQEVTML
jgi:hypothetical protein